MSGINTKTIDAVQSELAKEAGITKDQAAKVLSLLNINRMVDQAAALEKLLQDPVNTQALGYSDEHVSQLKQNLASTLTLSNLRISLKPKGLAVTIVV